jgi:hypothetical protein
MKWMRRIIGIGLAGCVLGGMLVGGCKPATKPYGTEQQLYLPTTHRQIWAVAPAVNLSGQRFDPLLQADLVYQQLQQVQGLTVIPVNRVVEVYAAMRIEKVESEDQAAVVCEQLGCDGLIVPSITIFDPYDPPKMGASLQLFGRAQALSRQVAVDPRQLSRQASGSEGEPLPAPGVFVQSVGMFDSANGSVRDAVLQYAAGRHDPAGPYQAREYFVDMDRYGGFVYHQLIAELLSNSRWRRP